MRFYSFDDQYNVVTSKCNTNNNNQVHNFSAIDYFQFKFTEIQLHNCWKLINQFNHEELDNCYIPQSTNIARLENLVWRKWTKTKYNLKETNPQSVNWYKDCDITWLYGPLVHSTFDDECSTNSSTSCSNIDRIQTINSLKSLKSFKPQTTTKRTDSFSSLSTTSTLDVGSFDNSFTKTSLLDDDKTIIFIDDNDDEVDYLSGPKPILKHRTSNGPLDFERFLKDCLMEKEEEKEESLGKTVSFADMVQIRQFY